MDYFFVNKMKKLNHLLSVSSPDFVVKCTEIFFKINNKKNYVKMGPFTEQIWAVVPWSGPNSVLLTVSLDQSKTWLVMCKDHGAIKFGRGPNLDM